VRFVAVKTEEQPGSKVAAFFPFAPSVAPQTRLPSCAATSRWPLQAQRFTFRRLINRHEPGRTAKEFSNEKPFNHDGSPQRFSRVLEPICGSCTPSALGRYQAGGCRPCKTDA
jgi:hypothetical protein